MKNINDTKFVIFDVETTGLSPASGDRVIEFAAIKSIGGKEKDRFDTLIYPDRNVSYEAFLINGITDEMLLSAPRMKDVAADILNFIDGSCLIAHNVKFDLGFMNHEMHLSGLKEIVNKYILDTVKMSRVLFPGLNSYSLASVAYAMKIEGEQTHRAMADVEMTFNVFKRLLSIAEGNGINDLVTLNKLCGMNKVQGQAKKDKISVVEKAISKEQDLKILYCSSNNGTNMRNVTPKSILGQGRSAMLVGFCHLRKAERSFLIDNIIDLEVCLDKPNECVQIETLFE
jgi:DNA polymerase III epsilon subunit family exonuclease